MLNFSARREAIVALDEAVSRHESLRARVTAASELLFERRERAARVVVVLVEAYVSALAKSPRTSGRPLRNFGLRRTGSRQRSSRPRLRPSNQTRSREQLLEPA